MSQRLKKILEKIYSISDKKNSSYSEFYKKVWIETSKIPKGKVCTYKQIAQNIGLPKTYRAVGNALNKNPFSPIIPCHRVVKSDYTLGGYSGGIKTKIKLLEKEGVRLKKSGKKIKVEI